VYNVYEIIAHGYGTEPDQVFYAVAVSIDRGLAQIHPRGAMPIKSAREMPGELVTPPEMEPDLLSEILEKGDRS
jgi:hypothetical protein